MTLREYIQEISAIYARGNATEHSYRPALKALLESLTNGIVATNEPRRIECGAPDYIIERGGNPLGYVEAKDIGQALSRAERTDQLKRYRNGLRNLILTDYLSFRWYVNGELRLQATLGRIGDDERRLVASPDGIASVSELLQQFITHHVETVQNSKELAERLAGVARLIREVLRTSLRQDGSSGPLRRQLDGIREVLLPDLTPDRFADIYAETIAYGLFAARCNAAPGERFNRRTAAYDLPRTNPFLRRLFNEIAGAELDERLAWIVDDAADLLDRTDIARVLEGFGRSTRREDPVFHFYETFLAAYDPSMREARGVYYTPEPVVSYIVRSVDHLLRSAFSLRGGLANSSMLTPGDQNESPDHRVLILDPAAGTGTFLHRAIAEVEREVKRTLGDSAWGGDDGYVAQHLLPRIFGFELLMAPYTVAHMKLGLQLKESGYDVTSDHRLGIYLTNTLEPSVAHGDQYQFVQWLVEEATSASAVKQTRPVMVVLGNPPYSGHSANNGPWISALLRGRDTLTDERTHSYFHIDGRPLGERNPKWLNDDYVKFIRFAQHRIERTGNGVLAFISNHGYLDNPTFRAMRVALMATFDEIYLLDLHGNAKKKERSPDGSPDQNVFDIQQGVAIGIFVRRGPRQADTPCRVRYGDLWGLREVNDSSGEIVGGKYRFLEDNDVSTTEWTEVTPTSPFFMFRPRNQAVEAEFRRGWSITRIFPVNTLGFQTHRDDFAIAFDRDEIVERVRALRDPGSSDAAIRESYGLRDNRDWKMASARAHLRHLDNWQEPIRRCSYRPYDERWCYFSDLVMDYPRRELLDHVAGRETLTMLVSRQQAVPGFRHVFVSRDVAESCCVSTKTKEQNYVFPLYLYQRAGMLDVENHGGTRRANCAPEFVAEVSALWQLSWLEEGRGDLIRTFGPEDVFSYVYAVLHIPSYRARYVDFLKDDFAHVPLAQLSVARDLIGVGGRLMETHLLETDTSAPIRLVGNGSRIVEQVKYLAREDEDAGGIRINSAQTLEPISLAIWDAQVGGFEVVQKWLKERKGRTLSADDLMHFQRIVAALESTSELEIELEQIIETAGGLPLTNDV